MQRRKFIGGLSLIPFLGFAQKDKSNINITVNYCDLRYKYIKLIIDEKKCIMAYPYKTTDNDLIESIKKWDHTLKFDNKHYYVFFDEINSLGTWIQVEKSGCKYVLQNKIHYATVPITYPKV